MSAALRSSPPLAWSFLYIFFCLLSGYYVLRPVREAMSASADVEAIFPDRHDCVLRRARHAAEGLHAAGAVYLRFF
ncbi:hypothetical protein GDR29_07030 [Xanthomonas oryzae pv. oryzae]|nr:hypothetical protein GDR29_07030 [Xanthomonas oryzae pv. oryzae]